MLGVGYGYRPRVMSLDEYRGKRDFSETEEPDGSAEGADGSRFVIQKHDATRLHYDFRLEANGVLKSWAVPKGPSTDPSEKRLAVPTEDHPIDYIDFEGVIPEGSYGAGPVIVWDRGAYRNMTEDDDGEALSVADAVAEGHVKFWLEGEKLRGGYALTRAPGLGSENSWLLVKMDDEAADARRNPTSTEPCSVLSGRTIEELFDES